MRKAFVALLCTLAFAVPVPSHAAIDGLILTRGSMYVPGGDVYNGNTRVTATKTLILPAGSTLTLHNLDLGAHNVYSGDPVVDGTEGNGLFHSDDTNYNTTAPVVGVQNLAPGEYRFFCSLHPSKVTGTLVIV